jgi:tetratricopeptide (TPR) repeat protein
MLLTANDPAGAARAISPISTDPNLNDPTVLILAVEAFTGSGRTEEARQRLDRLAKIEPNAPTTIACRALVLKTEGDLEGAASAIEQAAALAEKAPDGDRLSLFYFNQLMRLGLDDAADRLGQKIAGQWTRLAWVWARRLADRGQFDGALDSAAIAADAGSHVESLRVIASFGSGDKLNLAQAERARTLAVSIVTKDPRNSELLSLTAWMLRHQGKYDQEASLYRQVLATDPSNIQARNNLAWVLGDNLGRPAEGLVEVDQVIRQMGLSPQNGDTRGVLLLKLGRIDEAVAELERATKASPNAIHYLHLARALAAKGRATEARNLLLEGRKALTDRDRRDLEPADLTELVEAAER